MIKQVIKKQSENPFKKKLAIVLEKKSIPFEFDLIEEEETPSKADFGDSPLGHDVRTNIIPTNKSKSSPGFGTFIFHGNSATTAGIRKVPYLK